MIDTDKFVGNERSLSAVADLETPSKKALLKIAKDDGIKWAKENSVDFNFVNKSMMASVDYAFNENDESIIQQAKMFGFIVGFIEYVNEKED